MPLYNDLIGIMSNSFKLGIGTAHTLEILKGAQTGDYSLTAPVLAASDILVGEATSQVLSNKSFSTILAYNSDLQAVSDYQIPHFKQVKALIEAGEWLPSVKSRLSIAPESPTLGDRYMIPSEYGGDGEWESRMS